MGSDDDLLPADIKKEVTKKVNFVRRQPKKGDEAPAEMSMQDFFMNAFFWVISLLVETSFCRGDVFF